MKRASSSSQAPLLSPNISRSFSGGTSPWCPHPAHQQYVEFTQDLLSLLQNHTSNPLVKDIISLSIKHKLPSKSSTSQSSPLPSNSSGDRASSISPSPSADTTGNRTRHDKRPRSKSPVSRSILCLLPPLPLRHHLLYLFRHLHLLLRPASLPFNSWVTIMLLLRDCENIFHQDTS